MTELWRLFIALQLPEELQSHLSHIQDILRSRAAAHTVRWVAPEAIHLTLKFLGDTPQAQIEDVQEQLREACAGHRSFSLSTAGLGCFPTPTHPRVAWIGLGGQLRELRALRDAVESAVTPLGFPTEDRPFYPHLTLGRVRQDATPANARALGDLIVGYDLTASLRWTATSVALFRSELERGGAQYTPLFRVNLAS